jgi:hypothetical protein
MMKLPRAAERTRRGAANTQVGAIGVDSALAAPPHLATSVDRLIRFAHKPTGFPAPAGPDNVWPGQ